MLNNSLFITVNRLILAIKYGGGGRGGGGGYGN